MGCQWRHKPLGAARLLSPLLAGMKGTSLECSSLLPRPDKGVHNPLNTGNSLPGPHLALVQAVGPMHRNSSWLAHPAQVWSLSSLREDHCCVHDLQHRQTLSRLTLRDLLMPCKLLLLLTKHMLTGRIRSFMTSGLQAPGFFSKAVGHAAPRMGKWKQQLHFVLSRLTCFGCACIKHFQLSGSALIGTDCL